MQQPLSTMIVPDLSESDGSSNEDENDAPPTIIKKRFDAPKKPKSKYKGVFRCGKKFKSQIQTHGVQHYLGLFDVEEDAARAYDVHARLTFGPGKAKTNFDYDKNDMFPLPNVAMESIVPPPIPPSNNESGGDLKPKGAHPRRTYVGIKFKRKRLSEGGDIYSNLPTVKDEDSSRSFKSSASDKGGSTSVSPENCWSGDLRYDPSRGVIEWKGIWNINNSSANQFEYNEFEYTSPRCSQDYIFQDASATPVILQPFSGIYQGYFTFRDVKNKANSVKITDKDFLINFNLITDKESNTIHINTAKYNVTGSGVNQLGTFVVKGSYDNATKKLELYRDYSGITAVSTSAVAANNVVRSNSALSISNVGGQDASTANTVKVNDTVVASVEI